MIALHADFYNVITIHSLTKAFAVPGLRLGYLIGDEKLIAGISSLGILWSVNALAQEAGIYIMDNYDDLMPDVNALCEESAALQRQLNQIGQLGILPSACIFSSKNERGNSRSAEAFFLLKSMVSSSGMLLISGDYRPGIFAFLCRRKKKMHSLLTFLKTIFR